MKTLNSRYETHKVLGEGGIGITYKATDLQTDQTVALKVISFKRVSEWKVLELFEREVSVLKKLKHPGIPQYLDSFEVDTEDDRLFCIVQSLAPGKTLAQWVEEGWQPKETEIQDVACQLLEILIYLQECSPAIIHRDIKPQNILRDPEGNIYLVDFGAVRDKYRRTIAQGSTFVGTFGYMAPEQFRGQANLSTDLYGLGATLFFLLTSKDPINFQQAKTQKLRLPESLKISLRFRQWLQYLVEPAVEERCPSARVAMQILQGQEPSAQNQRQLMVRPKQTNIKLVRTDRYLHIAFSPHNFSHSSYKWNIYSLVASVAFIGFILFCLQLWGLGFLYRNGTIVNCIFSGLFAGAILNITRFWTLTTQPTSITINDLYIKLKNVFENFNQVDTLNFNLVKEANIRLDYVDMVCLKRSNREAAGCLIRTIDQKIYQFGAYLSLPEKQWLCQEIKEFIDSLEKSNQYAQLERVALADGDEQKLVNSVQLLLSQGVQFYQQEQVEQAQALFQAATLVEPTCAEAHNNLGVIQYQRGQYQEATGSFQQALAHLPGYRAARVNLGFTLEITNELRNAVEVYAEPGQPQATQGNPHLTLLVAGDRYQTLLEQLTLMREVDLGSEQSLEVQKQYAYLVYVYGDTTAAISSSAPALANTLMAPRPFFNDWFFNLGYMLATEGRIAEALVHLKKIDDLNRVKSDKSSLKISLLLDYISKPEYAQTLAALPT